MHFCYSTFNSAGSRRTHNLGFTGTMHSVTVDVSGERIEDEEATLRRMMAQQ